MKKRIIQILCLLLMTAGALKPKAEEDTDAPHIVIWNTDTRTVFDKSYSDRESFPYYLISEAEKYDNVMAEILVGEESGEFRWTYGKDSCNIIARYNVVESYKSQKAAPLKTADDGPAKYIWETVMITWNYLI